MIDTKEEAAIGNAAANELYEHEKAVEVLRAARALIADKSRWTQGATARNAKGASLGAGSAKAVCWCALGAITKTADNLVPYVRPESPRTSTPRVRVADAAIDLVHLACVKLYGEDSIAAVNDSRGYAAILACFDDALQGATT